MSPDPQTIATQPEATLDAEAGTAAEEAARPQADAAGLVRLLDEVAALVGFDVPVHLAKGRDAGDGLLAEGPGIGDGAEQFV